MSDGHAGGSDGGAQLPGKGSTVLLRPERGALSRALMTPEVRAALAGLGGAGGAGDVVRFVAAGHPLDDLSLSDLGTPLLEMMVRGACHSLHTGTVPLLRVEWMYVCMEVLLLCSPAALRPQPRTTVCQLCRQRTVVRALFCCRRCSSAACAGGTAPCEHQPLSDSFCHRPAARPVSYATCTLVCKYSPVTRAMLMVGVHTVPSVT